MTELDFKTFDLAQVLAGIDYPEDTVVAHLSPDADYLLDKAEKALARAERRGETEAVASLDEKVSDLREKVAGSKFTFHLKGISMEALRSIEEKAEKAHPSTKNMLGMKEDNPEGTHFRETLLWDAVLQKIEAPDGAVDTNITIETVTAFRNSLPRGAQEAISRGITNILGVKGKSFEEDAQDVDFLFGA